MPLGDWRDVINRLGNRIQNQLIFPNFHFRTFPLAGWQRTANPILIPFGSGFHPLGLFPDLLKHRRRQRLVGLRQRRVFNPLGMMNHRVKQFFAELRRIVAVYRLVLPGAVIRLAGGRGLLSDRGRGCFQSGANGVISGDMLTTAGITVETDRNLLEELGYEVK